MYDASKVKAASEAAAHELLGEPGNARYRASALAALGKLTVARNAGQLETLYAMALSIKDTYDEKGNDAAAQAVNLALEALETGYKEVTGESLGDATPGTTVSDATGINSVGLFSTTKSQRPVGDPEPARQNIAEQPEGALTVTMVTQAWPSRLSTEIRRIFDTFKSQADNEPGTMHSASYHSEWLGETLTLKGGKFQSSNTINMDGIQSKQRSLPTYYVDAESYEKALKPYLEKIALLPYSQSQAEAPAHVTARGSYQRDAFGSYSDSLNNVPPPVTARTREEIIDRLKAASSTPAHKDGSRTVIIDEKPLRVLLTPRGTDFALLIHRDDADTLRQIMKTRSSAHRCNGGPKPSHREVVRQDPNTGYGSTR